MSTSQPRDTKGRFSYTTGNGKSRIPTTAPETTPTVETLTTTRTPELNTTYDTYSSLNLTTKQPEWKVQRLTATPKEVGDLMRTVIHETFPPEHATIIATKHSDPERLATVLTTRTWFETRDPQTNALLAVACVYAQPDTDPPTAYLGSNYVLPRRQGIGSALTDARINWAREHGFSLLTTSIHEWNIPSQQNMRKHGLVPVGTSPDTWTGAGNMIIMEGTVPQ